MCTNMLFANIDIRPISNAWTRWWRHNRRSAENTSKSAFSQYIKKRLSYNTPTGFKLISCLR